MGVPLVEYKNPEMFSLGENDLGIFTEIKRETIRYKRVNGQGGRPPDRVLAE
jgi:hypothetical protein